MATLFTPFTLCLRSTRSVLTLLASRFGLFVRRFMRGTQP